MLRLLLTAGILLGGAYCATTVNLGERTLVGHIDNVWHSEEMLEMRRDIGLLVPAEATLPSQEDQR